ncbi:hypothetical protein M5E86_00615 [Blautia wexlerae]|nr:hypothetical protein M5E86_00615 [Blautia wexlerae]
MRAILTSVRLRSVGKNPQKAKALSGVLGISFLKSGEMAEEMHASNVLSWIYRRV